MHVGDTGSTVHMLCLLPVDSAPGSREASKLVTVTVTVRPASRAEAWRRRPRTALSLQVARLSACPLVRSSASSPQPAARSPLVTLSARSTGTCHYALGHVAIVCSSKARLVGVCRNAIHGHCSGWLLSALRHWCRPRHKQSLQQSVHKRLADTQLWLLDSEER